MKNMIDFKIINVDVYSFDIGLAINTNDKELKNILKYQFDNNNFEDLYNLPNTCVGKFYMSSENFSIIRLKIEEEIPHGTIAHEIFHCATFILDRVGIKFNLKKNDEAFAYLIGYITKKVYEIINKE